MPDHECEETEVLKQLRTDVDQNETNIGKISRHACKLDGRVQFMIWAIGVSITLYGAMLVMSFRTSGATQDRVRKYEDQIAVTREEQVRKQTYIEQEVKYLREDVVEIKELLKKRYPTSIK